MSSKNLQNKMTNRDYKNTIPANNNIFDKEIDALEELIFPESNKVNKAINSK